MSPTVTNDRTVINKDADVNIYAFTYRAPDVRTEPDTSIDCDTEPLLS